MALKVKNSRAEVDELNFIGVGTLLEGKLETKGSLRIDGKVMGTVKSGDTVTIGSSGEVIGEVFARNAIVGGKVQGNVIIEEKLILESTSALKGNLKASKLVIDEGAKFQGKADMALEGLMEGREAQVNPEAQPADVTENESLQTSG
ncbi:MAG: polymer-forming cytoskeletal protein [Calditrichaeota bacterium]|nr:MAG: polymer-forming cytoskeletal protein [Calditrichota bacterium]